MEVSFSYQRPIQDFDWETVIYEIESFCGQHSLPAAQIFTIQLIVEELVTNIIKYGKRVDGKEIINIKVIIDQNRILLIIADNTAPFNPLDAKEPDTELSVEERNIGGLGLVLVKQKARTLNYEYVDGFNMVEVQI